MARLERLAGDDELSGTRRGLAGEDVEELLLTLPLQRRNAEHLARPHGEREIRQLSGRDATHLERGCAFVVPSTGSGVAFHRDRRGARRLRPEHVLDNRDLSALARVDLGDRAAVSQDRRAVAGCDDFFQAMRDEENRPAARTRALHYREDALGEI